MNKKFKIEPLNIYFVISIAVISVKQKLLLWYNYNLKTFAANYWYCAFITFTVVITAVTVGFIALTITISSSTINIFL